MKKIMLALVAVFTMTLSVQAQDEGDRRPPIDKDQIAQRMTDMMVQQLELTADQKEAVLALNKKYADKIMPNMRGPRGPRPDGEGIGEGEGGEKKENIAEREADKAKDVVEEDKERVEYKEALKAVLTDEQYTKYEEMEKNMRHMGNRRGGGPRGEQPEANGEAPQGPMPLVGAPEGGCSKDCKGK